MFSNGQTYNPLIKPRPGCFLNPGLSINRGLVGNWPMWTGADNGIADLSYENTGTFAGTAPVWAKDIHGPVISLPGTDEYISCARPIMAGLSQVTVVAGVRSDTANLAANEEIVEETGSVALYRGANENIIFRIRTGASNYEADFTDGINDLDYHQVAGTYDGANVRVFVDGIMSADVQAATGVIDDNSNPLYFGARSTPDRFWGGIIDYVYIYNRALAASEIEKLYREPFCGYRWTSIIQLASFVAAAGGIEVLRRRMEAA